MPMRGELPPVSTRHYAQHPSALENARARIVAALGGGDLQAVAIFCLIGFLLTFNVIVRFPDFGRLVAELAVFP